MHYQTCDKCPELGVEAWGPSLAESFHPCSDLCIALAARVTNSLVLLPTKPSYIVHSKIKATFNKTSTLNNTYNLYGDFFSLQHGSIGTSMAQTVKLDLKRGIINSKIPQF
jgi:hypothetical protein